MTDLTTRPAEAGTPDPAPAPQPVNGAVVADIRTLRHVTRAEQERLSADAQVERRARAARLDLELREQRRAAARRERQADAADQRACVEQRRTRRAARRARLRAAAPSWAERALFVLPIMFPMAVAWVGQIRFAMTVMGWPLPAAIVFAAGFELSTAYVARLDWLSRAAGDSALLFRGATWGFAAGAATMNYWHAAGPGFAPTGEAVSYGLMSVTGVVLWELLSTYRHRTALRADGKLPAARPRFGLARWIWFAKLTRLAWLLTLRDGYPTTDLAWRAALGTVDLYGSVRDARKAVRTGRPVPRPEPADADDEPETGERDGEPDVGPGDPGTAGGSDNDRDEHDSDNRDGKQRDGERDITALDPAGPDRLDRTTTAAKPFDSRCGETGNLADGAGRRTSEASGNGAVGARMEAYARARLAEGAPITGADLDRQFGTRDYGRKVLRRLTEAGNSHRR